MWLLSSTTCKVAHFVLADANVKYVNLHQFRFSSSDAFNIPRATQFRMLSSPHGVSIIHDL